MIISEQLCVEVMCFLQESTRGVSYHQIADQFRNRDPRAAVCAAVSLEYFGYAEAIERVPFQGKYVPFTIRGCYDGLSRFLDERDAGDVSSVTDGYIGWTDDQVDEFFQEAIALELQ